MKTIISSFYRKASFLIFSLLVTGISFSYGIVYTASTSGNFSSAYTWSGGMVPPLSVQSDQIVIPYGISVILDNDLTLNGALSQLNVAGIMNTYNNSSLTVNNGTLIGAGTISLENISLNSGMSFMFTGMAAANTFNSAVSCQLQADLLVYQSLYLMAGTMTVASGGSLSMGTNSNIVIMGGNLDLGTGGSLNLTGNYNVTYTGVSAVAGPELSGAGLRNVDISVNPGNTVTLVSDLDIPGVLTLSSGIMVLSGYDLTIHGDIAASGSGTISSSSSSDIYISSLSSLSGPLRFTAGANTIGSFTVNVGAEGSVWMGSSVNVAGILTLSSGTMVLAGSDLTITGDIASSGDGTITSSAVSDITLMTSSSISGLLRFSPIAKTVGNFVVNIGGNGSVGLGSDLNIAGGLTLANGTLLLSDKTIVINGDILPTGTGNISSTSSSNITLATSMSVTGALKFSSGGNVVGDLTVNIGSNGSVMMGSDLQVAGNLKLVNGKLDLGGYNLSITGDIAPAGYGEISSSSYSDILVATSYPPSGALMFAPAANSVNNFTINIQGSGAVAIGSDLNVIGTLSFITGKLDIGSHALIIGTYGDIDAASNSSYIITGVGGYLQRHLSSTCSCSEYFPIGTSSRFAPAYIHLNSGSPNGQYMAGVTDNVWSMATSGTDLSASQPLVDATWTIGSSASGNLNYNLRLIWSPVMEVNGFNHDAAYLAHFKGDSWDMSTIMQALPESGGMYSMERNAVTMVDQFAVFDQSAVTDIAELSSNLTFDVFPNPVSDNLIIHSSSAVAEPVSMDIYNSVGQLMNTYVLSDAVSNISVAGLVNGNYFVKFHSNKMSLSRSFLKM